jgi:hypothetical protein
VATKRKKKKRRGAATASKRSGAMTGLRGGLKGIVGQGGPRKKESALSRWVSYLLLAAAVGLLIYRFVR